MRRKKKGSLYYVLAALLFAVFLWQSGWDWIVPAGRPTEFTEGADFTVVFFDIGQGDAALVASGDTYILMDSGLEENIEVITDFLDQERINTLDMVIATHPHADHIGGMDQIVEKYDIGEMVMSPAETTSATYDGLLSALEGKELGVTVPERGETRELGDLTLTFLWPEADNPGNDLNEASLVVRVEHADGGRLLFTGDIGEPSEAVLVQEMPQQLACQVLKVSHHGSRESSSEDFLWAVDAEIAVISVGEDNSYGHPDREALECLEEAGMTIYRTDKSGSLVCRWYDGRPVIEPLEGVGYRNAA